MDTLRRNVDFNWAEKILALILVYPNLNTFADIMATKDLVKENENEKIMIEFEHIDKYYRDISSRNPERVTDYIQSIKDNIHQLNIDLNLIDKVYITGKTFTNFQELVSLNTDPLTGKLYDQKITKSDIFIKMNNRDFIGISVKDSKNATLSNYSFEKILKDLHIENTLKDNRILVLKNKFGENYKYTNSNMTKSEKESVRKIANELFYDKDNHYFREIIDIFENDEYMDRVNKLLLVTLFPVLPYRVYGFSGGSFIDLNYLSNRYREMNIEIKRAQNLESNTSAKLWFTINFNGIPKYMFEIRGKNDLFKGSMQILTYKYRAPRKKIIFRRNADNNLINIVNTQIII